MLFNPPQRFLIAVATVLTVYGIETIFIIDTPTTAIVATVLTVYGIETNQNQYMRIVFYVLK